MIHRRIDVHHHILPPSYVAWLRGLGIHEAGGRDLPAWSPEAALRVMEQHFIETAVVSVSTPGVCPKPNTSREEARHRSREVNEIAADLVRNHPGRFGFFATLTLPDVDGALAEAAYALDDLNASGIILLANTHGRYLGDPDDGPLFEELNRREAVLFVHPSEIVGPPASDVAPFAADFLLDTSRAAYRLVRNGFMRKYPHLKIILSHAGGFVPYASYRMAGAIAMETSRPLEDVLDDFRSFYFDTELQAVPPHCPAWWHSRNRAMCSSGATGPLRRRLASRRLRGCSTHTRGLTMQGTRRSTGGLRSDYFRSLHASEPDTRSPRARL